MSPNQAYKQINMNSPEHTNAESACAYYAHSLAGQPVEDWQTLEDHLRAVANLARTFATYFGAGDWAYLAGLWHDIGKYSNEFQKMICDANGVECHIETQPGRVIHSQAGGHLAQEVMNRGLERIFCWLIMGHHSGLADYSASDSGAKALEPKMREPSTSLPILKNAPTSLKNVPTPKPPAMLQVTPRADISFLIRMLFSCVVDADFLDTEAFMDKTRAQSRQHTDSSLENLLDGFNQHMSDLCTEARDSTVNQVRANVLGQCRRAAEGPPTVYSLTVPTGGGKTLSSLAFALKHAVKHKKSRVIYVIPYTSIIEQTASIFRNIRGFEDAVLEHHSNIADEDETKENVRRRLATENWDVPIIVTTAVQFFESLYANKTSRCRKLHNIANSVIIFDEAQCLPPKYLRPIVFAIRELNRHYKVTPVLCTATQPVLSQTRSFDFNFREGFDSITEIIDKPSELTESLQRVSVECLDHLDPTSFERLTQAIVAEKQSTLCIVNTKKDAHQIAHMLPEENTIHLSTNMCAQHRLEIFDQIHARIKDTSSPLYVISTSLVEAGVDLDFPVVYRALAGLDSIAQAAGRCNREGRISGMGKAVVFTPEHQPDYVQSPASLTREYLTEGRLKNIFSPETFSNYFHQRFFMLGEAALDQKNILELLGRHMEYSFRQAAEAFKLIENDWQVSMIVPYGDAPETVDKLLEWDAKRFFRKLQRYVVNITGKTMNQLIDEDHARELPEYPGTYYLHNKALYSELYGFMPPDQTNSYDPQTMMC